MAGISVKVEGLRAVEAALAELPKATAKNVMRRVLIKRAQPIADRARRLVRKRTGRLAQSIAVSTRATGADAGKAAFAKALRAGASRQEAGRAARAANRGKGGTVLVYVGPGQLPHAHLIEFGRSKARAFPYLRPAWDSGQAGVLAGIQDDMWAEIRKAAARRARRSARAAARA